MYLEHLCQWKIGKKKPVWNQAVTVYPGSFGQPTEIKEAAMQPLNPRTLLEHQQLTIPRLAKRHQALQPRGAARAPTTSTHTRTTMLRR